MSLINCTVSIWYMKIAYSLKHDIFFSKFILTNFTFNSLKNLILSNTLTSLVIHYTFAMMKNLIKHIYIADIHYKIKFRLCIDDTKFSTFFISAQRSIWTTEKFYPFILILTKFFKKIICNFPSIVIMSHAIFLFVTATSRVQINKFLAKLWSMVKRKLKKKKLEETKTKNKTAVGTMWMFVKGN